MHHIISDGTSLSIFIDELCKLYNGESLSELKITYKDFAVFENGYIILKDGQVNDNGEIQELSKADIILLILSRAASAFLFLQRFCA